MSNFHSIHAAQPLRFSLNSLNRINFRFFSGRLAWGLHLFQRVTHSPQEVSGMRQRHSRFQSLLAMSALTTFFWLGTPANAQSVPAQNTPPVQDNDTTRQELASFNQFLDSHPELSGQLRKDPSLVNNDDFVKQHPSLQNYLQEHPQVREEIKENPNAFLRQESRYDRRADDRDRDINRQELARFDQFLDSHPEVAGQLRKDPSLVNNDDFVKQHPSLQAYLQEHPQVRQEIKENPNAFMRQESRYDRREDDRNREELARFDQFLDSHRETAEQLHKDPSLVNNDEFVRNHPALQSYLQEHPELREQIKQDPNAFMHQEARYDRGEDDRNRDSNRQELARFDQFLDSHRETAAQLRKDPSLVNNDEFVRNHPALQSYLREHPGVREEIRTNPNAFMQQEARYDRRADGMDRDSTGHRQSASFGEFLGGHSEISQRLSEDPSLVKNQEYMENHPELREYLAAHPDVKQELMANPQTFVKSAQQFSSTNSTAPAMKTPTADPAKPKQ
jgi:hypothetical protein